MSNLIRKYTPPTCTLEIWGNSSPIAVWMGKNVLTDAHFELRFDDPRMSEDKQISLKGDRTQLQLLGEIVANYVQNLLSTPVAALSLVASSSPETNLPSLPSLHCQGLLQHQLFLGSLVTDTDKEVIELTTSQLFDLASALEEYGHESALIPQLIRQKTRKDALVWTGLIASAIVAAAGTAIAFKMYQEQPLAELETNPNAATIPQPLPTLPLPPTGNTASKPNLPTNLANKTPLSPPPPVGIVIAPVRPNTAPLVIPPPPPVASAPSNTAIVIEPNQSPLSAPPVSNNQGTNALVNVNPVTMNPTPPPPNLPSLPPLNPENVNSEVKSPTNTATAPNTTLLDTIPQVTETREYFKSRWQAPASLKQTLEYRLVLNQDGSLKQIIPLGQAAKIYLDRTNMPLLNEPFVSPLDIAGNPQLRLVLSPDGTVRTFMEQL
jgi:Domain of unknown function (DUF4335)